MSSSYRSQSVPNLPNLWRPTWIVYWTPFYTSPAHFVALLLWLNVSTHHSWRVILLNHIIHWTCSALLPCYLRVWQQWHGFCYYSDLIPQTQANTHRTNSDQYNFTHIWIYADTTCYMCTPVLHWMNNFLIQKITLQGPTCLLFKKIKSFLWNTKFADRNGKNGQNKHREKNNFRKD